MRLKLSVRFKKFVVNKKLFFLNFTHRHIIKQNRKRFHDGAPVASPIILKVAQGRECRANLAITDSLT